MANPTFFWHDYETFGVNPARTRPAQFAGVRTDLALNPVADPVVIYCKPVRDILPAPEACLITGITPQIAAEKGIAEHEFIGQINDQLSHPGTCGAGFNSIRFDDEVTRYTLYRNFLDPYAREWQNQCSRWDIIDLARMTYALRPQGINWPQNEQGDPSFKLEHLAAANQIQHDAAHDALSDVVATIGLAKLIRSQQPKLYQWLYELRKKDKVAAQVDVRGARPFVHSSRMYPASRGCTSVVLPLGFESKNKSSLLVYDLAQDPDQFLEMDQDSLLLRLFTPREELPDGAERLPVKSLKINKCPAIAPMNTLTEPIAARIQLDLDRCLANRSKIIANPDFVTRIMALFAARSFEDIADVDLALYQGFIDGQDKKLMQQIRESTPAELASGTQTFNDKRLPELLFRYRARNWPESLHPDETERWQEHCEERLQDPESGLEQYFSRITELRAEKPSLRNIQILDALEQWGDVVL